MILALGPGKVAILVLVGGLLCFFAVLGMLLVTRGTPLSYVAVVGGHGRPPAVSQPEFAETFSLFTGSELQPLPSAELYTRGDSTFERLWADLRSARELLTIEIYYAEPGRVADHLAATLAERARAGVRVFFLYDAFGAGPLGDAYFDRLRAAGVRVAPFRPVRWYTLHKAQQRAHVRAIVVDGRVAWTGGLGIADMWLGDGRHAGSWRDTEVRFTGPAARRLQAAFLTNWIEATGELLAGPLFFPTGSDTSPPATTARAALVHSVPALGSTDAERLLALSIIGARRTLYVTTAYFVPDDDFRRLLVHAARRGVDVRVLVPGEHVDVPLTRYAGRDHYEELLRGGVRVFEYGPSMLHAKTLVADGVWNLVGTMNFDNRSLALNNEVVLAVQDEHLGATLDSIFADDLRYASEVELNRFASRSIVERIRERVSALIARLL